MMRLEKELEASAQLGNKKMSVCNERKKSKLLKLYRHRCAYCGTHLSKGTVTMDHVRPKSVGGKQNVGNIVPACGFCNNFKKDDSVEEFRKNILEESKKDTRIKNRFGVEGDKVKFYFEKIEDEHKELARALHIGNFKNAMFSAFKRLELNM